MKTITDTTILDDVVEQLCSTDTTCDGVAFVNLENLDKDIYVEGSVKWLGGFVDHFITLDGRDYLDFTEFERHDFTDLELTAWIGQEEAELDIAYIENALENSLN
jgi:hypothetical protein